MRDMEIPSIDTERLSLVSMSMEFLRLMIERDYEAAGKMGGFSISDDYSLPIFRTPKIPRASSIFLDDFWFFPLNIDFLI